MLFRISNCCARFTQLQSFAMTARHFYTSSIRVMRSAPGRQFAQQGVGIRAGPTLRERLLGPTTGKPFVYGTYTLAGASLFGLGMLCYYGLGLSKGSSSIANSVFWPQYVCDRLRLTYGYLMGSLGITAMSGVAASRSPAIMRLVSGGSLVTLLVSLAAIIGSGVLVQMIDYDNTALKHLAWLAHTAIFGAFLAPLCFLGGPALIRAAWYTAGITAGLSLTALSAPSERFLRMAGPLAMGLGIVFVANIGTFFLPPTSALGASMASVVIYGGLILFSAFLLYDTQRIVKMAEEYPVTSSSRIMQFDGSRFHRYDPINAQISIYLDVLNIFIRMAMILGTGGNRRR